MEATLNGLVTCFRREAAFRQECFFGAVNVVLAVLVPRTWAGSVGLIAVYFLLPVTELLNSAIEETVDLVTEEWNERAKRAKDYASAAIFLSIVLICIAWAAVLCRRASSERGWLLRLFILTSNTGGMFGIMCAVEKKDKQ